MTEKEWNECRNIDEMLWFVKGDRKLRLFVCAFLRQFWFKDDKFRHGIIVAEQFADGLGNEKKLFKVRTDIWNAWFNLNPDVRDIYSLAAHATEISIELMCISWYLNRIADNNTKILLFKDIFDPFGRIQKPKINKTIIHFANEIYNNHDENGFFNEEDLNILADMLYDEGYDNDHLRSGIHVKGCQVIDLILGKK